MYLAPRHIVSWFLLFIRTSISFTLNYPVQLFLFSTQITFSVTSEVGAKANSIKRYSPTSEEYTDRRYVVEKEKKLSVELVPNQKTSFWVGLYLFHS